MHDTYDLIVIGAGINGVGVAQDAALRGLRVLLLEQEDICSGVSTWSGRLAHGGLRYLEHYDVRLVRESLRERERLSRLAPHLVKPVPLLMPLYRTNRRPPWLIRLGMLAYDVLSWDKSPPRHRMLSAAQTRARFSGLAPDGLEGAALFYDGQVEYAERLRVGESSRATSRLRRRRGDRRTCSNASTRCSPRTPGGEPGLTAAAAGTNVQPNGCR